MANLNTDVPLVNSAFVDEKGNITEQWLLFLIQLWRRTGNSSGTDTTSLDQVFGIETNYANNYVQKDKGLDTFPVFPNVSPVQNEIDGMVLADRESTSYTRAVIGITLTASPMTYTATMRCGFYVGGGSVSGLSYRRGGVNSSLAASGTGQIIEMSPGDSLVITYSGTPTLRVIPR